MIEIRIHGRGGQGSITAAEILATAVFKDGKHSQAFPFFGTERAGAPVTAFCRISDKFIQVREHVYQPDYVLVLDPTLIRSDDILDGLKKNGMIIVNTSDDIKLDTHSIVKKINLTKIALEEIGKPFVNIAMLGAFAAATKKVSIESIIGSVRERFPESIAEPNIRALKRAYEGLK